MLLPPPTFPHKHPALNASERCCFRCSMRSLQMRVAQMSLRLPPGAWERKVRQEMVLPLLRRLSLFDPLRRMPLRWLEEEGGGLPAVCPVSCEEEEEAGDQSTKIKALYWELCHMTRTGPAEVKKKKHGEFFERLGSKAYNILHIITVFEGRAVQEEARVGLSTQIRALKRRDDVYTEINYMAINESRGHRNADPRPLAQRLRWCGAEEYGLFLVEHLRPPPESCGPGVGRALDKLRDAVVAGRANEAAKVRALRMALHPRSAAAGIRVLGSELLRLCALGAGEKAPKIVLWEEVLAEWL